MDSNRARLKEAVDLAIEGKWSESHERVQGLDGDPIACWIHAILHRIEGDDSNARYWYRRAGRPFVSSDPAAELQSVLIEHLRG